MKVHWQTVLHVLGGVAIGLIIRPLPIRQQPVLYLGVLIAAFGFALLHGHLAGIVVAAQEARKRRRR